MALILKLKYAEQLRGRADRLAKASFRGKSWAKYSTWLPIKCLVFYVCMFAVKFISHMDAI